MAKTMPGAEPVSEFTESINALIYGDSGVGKTVLGASVSSLILATEPGTISAARQGSQATARRIETWRDFEDSYNWLRDNPDHGYPWVVIDSATAAQELAMRGILDWAVEENASRDPDLPALQDWNKWHNMFKRYVKAFNDLPVNVLWIATVHRGEDEDGEVLVMPNFQNTRSFDMRQWMAANQHLVAYYGVRKKGKGEEEELTRRLICQSSPPYFAKDRYNALGRWMDNPSLADITDRITGSGGVVARRPAAKSRPAARSGPTPARRRPPAR